MKLWDVFLGAGLNQPGCIERNKRIIDLVHSLEMTIFAPQLELPLGCSEPPEGIVLRNRIGIENSRIFLFVPEGAGKGVYYELGIADAQNKLIIGFSQNCVNDQGKVFEGRWAMLPAYRKARSLEELHHILKVINQRSRVIAFSNHLT